MNPCNFFECMIQLGNQHIIRWCLQSAECWFETDAWYDDCLNQVDFNLSNYIRKRAHKTVCKRTRLLQTLLPPLGIIPDLLTIVLTFFPQKV